MIKRLRRKFIMISIIAVCSVMILLFVAVNTVNFVSVNSKLDDTLDMITSNRGIIPDFKGQTPPEGEMREPEKGFNSDNPRFNEETPFSTRFFVLIFDENGNQIRADLDKIAAVTEEDTSEYLSIAVKHGEGYGFTDGYKYKIVRQQDGNYMAVFLNDEMEISSVFTVLFVSLGATVGCIALICVIIVLFSKKAMDPVIQSNQKQKQFITDASHELKTPITVINTSLSVLEMEVGEQKWIDKAKGQTEKLTDLVNSLVTLSKMDEEKPLQTKDFSVSDAVQETAESFSDFSESQGHKLNIVVEPDIVYCGDEYSVRQLVSILIDNAVKYATTGTPISFSLKKDKKGVVISTENESENVDVNELDKLFDRFYRADKARSEKSGFGIGLSIARSICEAHKGSINASCADGKTVRFTAKLR
jgi:signal transduction histidine kinase